MDDALVMVPAQNFPAGAAELNITWDGTNGSLLDPVPYDASDADLKAMASEAVANGDVPGVPAAQVDFTNFVVDRIPATETTHSKLFIRAKTPVG